MRHLASYDATPAQPDNILMPAHPRGGDPWDGTGPRLHVRVPVPRVRVLPS